MDISSEMIIHKLYLVSRHGVPSNNFLYSFLVFALTYLECLFSKFKVALLVYCSCAEVASHIYVRSRVMCNGGWRPPVVFSQLSNVLQVDRNFATAEPSALRSNVA